ncbi:fluoride efflux transporter CrcB [Priestia megaterium]|uniref:fluoride efflux transporter CrcB n=1 Tax=Priestia megaterium TaxID=1404 RepID=UPI003CFF595F
MSIVSLALGGAAGGICRYLLGLKVTKTVSNPPFPVSMLFVNLLGAFGLGLFYGSYYGKVPSHAYDDSIFLMISIGFFGSFTTFSTFSVETVQLIREKSYRKMLAYVGISAFGTVVLFTVGLLAGTFLFK